jgi:phage terminase small subunit
MFTAVNGGEGTPPEPDWTSYAADELDLAFVRAQWRSIVNEMRDLQTLTVDNGDAIRRLVMFRLEFDRQARSVAEHGVIRKAKRTKSDQIHPSWTVMKQAAEAAGVIERDLGISPLRRNNAGKVQRKTKRTTAADEFLRPVAGGSSHAVGKAGG